MNRVRIKTRLSMIMLSIFLIVTALGWSAVNISFRIYDQIIYSELADKLHLYSQSLEDRLWKMDELSSGIFSDHSIQAKLRALSVASDQYDARLVARELEERLIALTASQKFINSVEIMDVNQKIYGTGFQRINLEEQEREDLLSLTTLAEGANILIMPEGRPHSAIMAREIRDWSNLNLEPLGQLIIHINITKLVSDTVRPLNAYESQLLLIDKDNRIYSPNEGLQVQDLKIPAGEKGFVIDSLNGSKVLIAYSPFDYAGWTLVHIVPYGNIFRNVSLVKGLMIAAYTLLFVVGAYFIVRFSKSITNPVDSLINKMKTVEKGIFEQQESSPAPLNRDELGRLQRTFDKMVERINELVQENYLKQMSVKESEYRALQARINPHFLYNTLDSINWLAVANKQPDISRMAVALGDLLRNSIESKDYVTVREELEMLQNYVYIQSCRYEERLTLNILVEESHLTYVVPKLILQPIVENAIQYGIDGITGHCSITITSHMDEEHFIITITDTGKGLETDYLEMLQLGIQMPHGTGLGLQTIHERVRGLYGQQYGIMINESDLGTSISIRFPVV
jgi:two-component system sensor histidine kinase YesM